ncbi:MAG: hypothetical protein M0Z64_04205 [Nitrospiraceae bacterium]|nr:hypothetical protein [Nitrospiraceae bacterium]
MDINELLKNACSLKASDIHIKVGSPPVFRIDGKLVTNPSDFALKVKGIQSAGDVITESYKDVKTEKDKDSGEFQIERF